MTPNEICPRKNTVVGHTFSTKNRLRRAKIDWIMEPIPKNFRLRRAEYLLTTYPTYLVEVCKQCGLVSNQ